jgi:hypothetical protein
MTTTQAHITRSQATTRRMRAGDSKRVFAVSALLVTPLAFAATLLLALPAGAGNAATIALVPALFTAGFFGGLYWLAVAVKRDERMALPATTTDHNRRPVSGSRAA